MTPTESPPILAHRDVAPLERHIDRLVVWVRGEHDISTAAALSETLARQIALDDRDLVVDLSGVRFMDASTIGVIVRMCGQLQVRSRSLVLRSPSMFARRILDICGLADLIDQDPVDVVPLPSAAGALGTWVAVPVVDRVEQPACAASPTLVLAGSVPVASQRQRT